jgi:hypothetical protein
MAHWSVGAVLSLLAVAAAVAAAAAEGPAPAPSVEESSGYQNYRHQVRLCLQIWMQESRYFRTVSM